MHSTAITSHDEMGADTQVVHPYLPASSYQPLTTYTASGNLPSNLSFLLSSWFADPQELPHIAFGRGGSFFFQSSALAAWEHLPQHLDTLLNELRESRGVAIPARSLALGENGSFVFLTGANGEIPVWDGIDAELAHRLSGDEERITVRVNISLMLIQGQGHILIVTNQSTALSLATREDYLIVFSDGSIFYSVPDDLIPVIQRFVRTYHLALQEREHLMACLDMSRPASPRAEMAATMAAMATKCATRQDHPFSLELPDGILGWDEDVITRYIEEAVGVSRSENTSTSSSPSQAQEMGLARHSPHPHPYPPYPYPARRAIGSPLAKRLAAPIAMRGRGSGTDYAASWVESQGMHMYDPLGMQLTHGMVVEL